MDGIKAKKAIKLWKDFVTKNHHKSRDFDFVILELGAFYDKEKSYVAILPNPYIINAHVCSNAWKNKNLAIIDLILSCFVSIEDWCNEVLDNPNDYDSEQRDQAKFFERTEKERKALNEYLRYGYNYEPFYFDDVQKVLGLDYL